MSLVKRNGKMVITGATHMNNEETQITSQIWWDVRHINEHAESICWFLLVNNSSTFRAALSWSAASRIQSHTVNTELLRALFLPAVSFFNTTTVPWLSTVNVWHATVKRDYSYLLLQFLIVLSLLLRKILSSFMGKKVLISTNYIKICVV